MKKRLRGLLALSVVACMVFAMTTGVASAVSFNGSSVPNGRIDVSTGGGTLDNPRTSGGLLVYDDGELVSTSNPSSGYTIYNLSGTTQGFYGADSFDVNATTLKDRAGYASNQRDVSVALDGPYYRSVASQGSPAAPCDIVYFTRIPINYQLNYLWDGGSYKDTAIFTVKAATGTIKSNEDASIVQKKDGYRFAGWKLKDGTIIPAGASISQHMDALIKNAGATVENPSADPNAGATYSATIDLTAAWVPLDKSPDAGDDFSAAGLVLIMTLAAGGAFAVKRKKA